MSLPAEFWAPLLGLFVGLVSVFLGLGGGILMVPLLPWCLGFSLKQAIATSLCTIFFVVLSNTWRFHRRGLVRWSVAIYMGPASALMAFIAGNLSRTMDEQYLLIILASIFLLIVLRLFFKKVSLQSKMSKSISLKLKLKAVAAGGFAGFASGMSGIGSGSLMGPLMIHWRLVGQDQLSPTSNASMTFTTAAGALAFLLGATWNWPWLGLVNLKVMLLVLLTALATAQVVSPFQHLLALKIKANLLSAVLLFLAIRIFYLVGQRLVW